MYFFFVSNIVRKLEFFNKKKIKTTGNRMIVREGFQ